VKRRAFAVVAFVVAAGMVSAALLASGCLDGLRPIAVVDTTPPAFQVVSPIDTIYDTDGDKLLDLELTWRDSLGVVDLASVRVRSLMGVNGTADTGTNLLSAWQVVRLDSTGLLVRETLAELLHGGVNAIEVSLADTAGNRRVDTVAFTLPHGVLLKTIVTGLASTLSHGIGVAVCPDDRRVYMAAGRRVVVADADSLTLIAAVENTSLADDIRQVLCVQGDPVLYATHRVERFHRPTLTWLATVTGSFGSEGITQSRASPDTLYVGEALAGVIGVIRRSSNTRVGYFLPLDTTQQEHVFDVTVLPQDAKLYATRYAETGILVADPRTGQILSRIRVGGPSWPDLGATDDFVLSVDSRHLYAAVLDGDPRGVVDIDTSVDSVVRTIPLDAYVPQALGLSPSERRMFVTTQDRFQPSQNVLIDVQAWTVLAEFPRPRQPGEIRFDGGVAFHPHGKFIFVAHNLDIDVYLSRE
jgi:DNA-binding beta-propeller fold protein YncE